MPTMEIPIKNVPTFGIREKGYVFTGNLSLPEIVTTPIQINSMTLYYGYGRRYVRYVFLEAVCGDTTFKTDYFSLKADESLKKLTVTCNSMVAGADHLLKQDGRTITFTIRSDYGSSDNTIDRPRAEDMLLTVNYTLLFEKSPFTVPDGETDIGEPLTVTVAENALNAEYEHRLTLSLNGESVSASHTGPGEITLTPPREWLALVPDTVTAQATLTLETEGAGQTGSEAKIVTLAVPEDVVPTIGGLTVERIDGRVPSAWGLFLKGESSARIQINGATPGEGSEIASYQIYGAGFAGDTDVLTTGKISTAGEVTFTAVVTDKRGRSARANAIVAVTDYALPSLSSFEAERCDEYGESSDDGVYIKGIAEYEFTAVADNAPTFKVYANGILVTPVYTNAIGEFTFRIGGGYDTARGYDIKVEVFDAVTIASNAPAYLTDRVPTATVAFDSVWDEGSADYGISMGRYAQLPKRLSIPEDWKYYRGETDIEQLIREADEKAGEALEAAGSATFDPLAVYPVGALYISIESTSPASLFGGTWEQLEDRFLIGAGSSYAAGGTGGRTSVTLAAAIGAADDTTKTIAYDTSERATAYMNANTGSVYKLTASSVASSIKHFNHSTPVTESTGTNRDVNIIPPYLAVYMWRRTA